MSLETDETDKHIILDWGKSQVNCEYFSMNGSCKALTKDKEGVVARDESCVNDATDACCYGCSEQEMCEISCSYLGGRVENKQASQRVRTKARLNHEIAKYNKSIERLSVFHAEGKISKESYLRSVHKLEGKIDELEEFKKAPDPSDSEQGFGEFDEDEFAEKSSVAWYLLPLLFGLLGGIIGYVGTKDRDDDMADSLLIFSVIWTFVLAVAGWALMTHAFH